MDGLCRVAGGRVDVTLCRRFFWLRPLTLGDLCIAEYWLLARRQTPVEKAEEQFRNLPHLAAARQELLDRAEWEMRTDRSYRLVTAGELMEWLFSDDGLKFIMFRCLERREGRSYFTDPAKCDKLWRRLTPAEVAEFRRRVSMISGFDLMAKMDWSGRGGEPNKRPHSWRKLYRSFAERFHWDADQVDRLTLYQLKVYTAEESSLGGTTRMPAKEAMEFMRQRQDFSRQQHRHDPKDTPARREARRRIMEQFAAKRSN